MTRFNTKTINRLTAVAASAALAATGIAAAADAPVVSKQATIAGTAVVTVPGTGVAKGEWMGSKTVLVFRDVTLERGQTARVTLRAPEGKRIRGLATGEGSKIGFKADGRRYAGDRKVTVTAFTSPRAADGEHTGRIYALTR